MASSTCDEENSKSNVLPASVSEDIEIIYDHPSAKAASRCWKLFGFYKVKPGKPSSDTLDMSTAVCKICRKTYANKANTSTFLNHIGTMHPDHSAACRSGGKKDKQLVQPKLSFEKPNRSVERTKALDDAVMKLIVGKVLPVSLVDNEYFKQFVGLLDPKYKLPSRRDLVRGLEKKQDEMKAKISEDIKDSTSIAITHDGWTSLNTESYNTTTAHFLDKDWNMKTAILGTKKMEGSHTSENIAESLMTTKNEWKLPRVVVTTDNAANEKKAFQILKWERFGCYGHRINLIVRNALEVPEIRKILAKSRKLVTFFHSSSSCTEKLYSKQKLLLPPQKADHKLQMDVVTRWNSTLDMLVRLLEIMPAIMALANDETISKAASTTIKNCAFNFDEIENAEQVVALLQPFKKATEILCAELVPTMHKVLPVVLKLSRAVEINENDLPLIKALKTKMSSELTKRTEIEEIALAACVLHPYRKEFDFMPEMRQEAHDLLKRLAYSINVIVKCERGEEGSDENNNDPILPDLPALPTEEVENEPPAKKARAADDDDWLDDVICTGESYAKKEDLVAKELTMYFDLKIKEGQTVLQWWKENEQFFPILSKLARKYLCVQASSVPSERVFSLAGHLVNKKRCRMSPGNVDMLIFLNKNLKEYW